MNNSFKWCIPVLCMIACSNRQPDNTASANDSGKKAAVAVQSAVDSFAKGKIIDRVVCKSDSTQSYALYIPVMQQTIAMPIIYCFDPHGDGSLPLKNYKTLADAYHFILVGSNNSKNGNDWNTTQAIWNTLLDDTQSRIPFNKNLIYTCGFSGGAKVAVFVALRQNGIKGVIAAGAGLPENTSIKNLPFSFTGMAGRGDMNMTDLVALNNILDKTTSTHRLILFDGKHAWPPADMMHIAFAGLQLDAMRSNVINKNDSLILAVTNQMHRQIDADIAGKKMVEAQQTSALAINLLQQLSPETEKFLEKENTIITTTLYRQQLQTTQQLFAAEQNQKQVFQQQFQQGDSQYWTTTINNLIEKAKASTAEGAMNQRLLAYLSLAFYSISNNLIQNNQNEGAAYFVHLYKMADATNPEAWYFSAQINARNNRVQETEADLLKAATFGFTDTVRMLRQPEFQTLSPGLNFPLFKGKMKKEE